jgi:adenine-specific DNA-methyltransferase
LRTMAEKGRYTKYSNKIGLYSNSKGSFVKNDTSVVLNFPFKDAVLEGGMSKEDVGREERFLHLELDSKDIDTLEEPKVLTDFSYVDKDGEKPLTVSSDIEFFDADGNLKQNLLIKGNNLLALYTLRQRLAGQVKLIYIDPPYNTGSDGFRYNDSFNHSAWLAFMKNRLEVVKDLLRSDGAIAVQCDDNEQAYLKVLLDEVFGTKNFINNIVIKTKVAGVSGSHQGKSLQNNAEYILFYAKDSEYFEIHENIYKKEELASFIKRYEAEGKSWKYTSVLLEVDDGEYVKSIIDGYGNEIKVYKHDNFKTSSVSQLAKTEYDGDVDQVYKNYADKIFRTTNAQSSVRQKVEDETQDIENNIVSILYVPKTGKNAGKEIRLYYKDKARNLVTWLRDVLSEEDGTLYKQENAGNIWDDIQYNNLTREGNVVFANGKKPEKILENLMKLTTNPGDLVLDYHLGSGTTSAVAHKMKRRWVGVEQMDYIETIAKERLKKVLDGEQGGISKEVGWGGGGSFVYFELKQYNQEYVERIMKAISLSELEDLYVDMRNNAFLKFWFDRHAFEKDEDFRKLDLDGRKKALVDVLDENQLYLNYADMDDTRHNVTADEKTLTDKFYGTPEN